MTTERLLRTFLLTAVLALSAAAALSFASSANAAEASKCGQKVLADWYDNGRIDRLYPLYCYEDAIDEIPGDIGPYVDAEDVITRALQGAMRGHLSAGGCDPSADGSKNDCKNAAGGGKGGKTGDGTGSTTDPNGNPQAAPGVNTSSPSSVPIPLLVLGGMSLLLLAAGGLGYVSRRRQAAQADDFGDDDPLA